MTTITTTHLDRYADTLIWGLKTAKVTPFKKNDTILIRYDRLGLELTEILYSKLLDMGLNPIPRAALTPNMEKAFYAKANHDQLTFQAPGDSQLMGNIAGSIYIRAPESITHLSGIDTKKLGIAAIATQPIRTIMNRREDAKEFGWTLCMLPTEELAKFAGMTLDEYSDQIIKSCFLDHEDPVSKWKSIFETSEEIKVWLNGMDVSMYRVESKNTDLWVSPGMDRKWIGVTGHNIPSFELFLSPDYRETRGYYTANQPSYRSGNYVEDVRLDFINGIAVNIKAGKGEAFVKDQLYMDEGARRIGEFSLTDKRFSNIDKFMANTLFDENFGGDHGNCHIAVGSSYTATYAGNPAELTDERRAELGFNNSSLHWDLVNTESKTVTAFCRNGDVIKIYEDGKFTCC
jgi:aminopeptidase